MAQMGEGKGATLRIEAPESARKAVTTIGVDPRHPLADGLEVDLDEELSLARGMVRTRRVHVERSWLKKIIREWRVSQA